MKKSFILLSVVCILLLLCSCKTKNTSEEEQLPLVSVKATPVIKGDIKREISFNGSTVYLNRNQILSPISGYVRSVNVKYGDEVQKNEVLYEIQTKERKALEADSSSGDFGNIEVRATSDGFVNDLTVNEPGVYVSEGGTLCIIVDIKDLMVWVNVPFEYNYILTKRRKCTICLTDKTIISGSVSRILPVVDEVNQTQTVLIRPETNRQLPENLNLIIKFLSEDHQQVLLISKSSLMTNETQSEFWIMKIVNGNMAVKIPVLKGIENDSIVEIIASQLNVNDLVLSEGAYGMPDSTQISITR